jgi:hypothetical protein
MRNNEWGLQFHPVPVASAVDAVGATIGSPLYSRKAFLNHSGAKFQLAHGVYVVGESVDKYINLVKLSVGIESVGGLASGDGLSF